jgi:hypothetical protein
MLSLTLKTPYFFMPCLEFLFCSFMHLALSCYVQPISGEITMHALMMTHSGSWRVYIVVLIITCLWARNSLEESQMERFGMASSKLFLMHKNYTGINHSSRVYICTCISFAFLFLYLLLSDYINQNLLQVPNIWWNARLELYTCWVFWIDIGD